MKTSLSLNSILEQTFGEWELLIGINGHPPNSEVYLKAKTFESEKILVCDAIEPNMTFAVPLSAGIVERRGGMLIHGAIIAREYGLPCVTGVPEATAQIHAGDLVTVDRLFGDRGHRLIHDRGRVPG